MTTVEHIAALVTDAEAAILGGDHALAGALLSQVNVLQRAIVLAEQAEKDGDHMGAVAIRNYTQEMEI